MDTKKTLCFMVAWTTIKHSTIDLGCIWCVFFESESIVFVDFFILLLNTL